MQATISQSKKKASSKRILWLDFAKSYGMVLVFLGHIVESFYQQGFTSAFLSYKAIYSFHVPLFFLLCGYLSKVPNRSLQSYLKSKLFSRVVPFLFFNLAAFLLIALLDIATGKWNFWEYFRDFTALLMGIPAFNLTTWFLICLLAIEIIHFGLCSFFKASQLRLLVAIALFSLGYVLTLEYRWLAMNLWFFPAAMVAYTFYTLGAVLRFQRWFADSNGLQNLIGFWISLVIMLLTFNLNKPLLDSQATVVNIALSTHGQPLLFLITGIAGSLAVIYLARWSASNPFLCALQNRLGIGFIGVNTLMFLGLNGLLMFVNYRLAGFLASFLPDEPFVIFPLIFMLTFFSLLGCVPMVLGLKRHLPQFVGLSKH